MTQAPRPITSVFLTLLAPLLLVVQDRTAAPFADGVISTPQPACATIAADGEGSGDLCVSHRQGENWAGSGNPGRLVNDRDNEMCPNIAGWDLLFSRSGQWICGVALETQGVACPR